MRAKSSRSIIYSTSRREPSGVRIGVAPRGKNHHAGEFVQVAIAAQGDNAKPTLAVP